MNLDDAGPEKAGVGGSIPSLATILSTTYKPSQAQSGRIRLQLFPDYPSQRILKLGSLSVEVFPQRRVDKGLVAGRTARFFRHPKEAVDNVLVEPNGDPGFAFGLRFRRKNSTSLALAEIVSVFHRSAS
jgi:hypothetical protein